MLLQTNIVTLVTEENAVRAIAIMVDRTVGIEVDELLLPENYLEKLGIPRRVNEDEEDGHEMEVELDKEMIRKSTKPLSSTKKDTENILGPTGKALHKLVSSPTPIPPPGSHPHRSTKPTP